MESYILFLVIIPMLLSLIAMVFVQFTSLINMIRHTAPFVPTGKKEIRVIKEELTKRGIKSLIDLGSGDGKLLNSLASSDLHATGYENSFSLYLYSVLRKKLSRNNRNITIELDSLFNANLQGHDAIFIYGIPGMMKRTQDKILRESKTGTLVISNAFDFPDLEKLYEIGKLKFYLV